MTWFNVTFLMLGDALDGPMHNPSLRGKRNGSEEKGEEEGQEEKEEQEVVSFYLYPWRGCSRRSKVRGQPRQHFGLPVSGFAPPARDPDPGTSHPSRFHKTPHKYEVFRV
jgi:hypothetical protein